MYVQLLTESSEPITRFHRANISVQTDQNYRRFELYLSYELPNPEIMEFILRALSLEHWFEITVKENQSDAHHTTFSRCLCNQFSGVAPEQWQRDDEGFVEFTWYAHHKFLVHPQLTVEEPIPEPVYRVHSLADRDWRLDVVDEMDREILTDIRNSLPIERPERVIRRDTRIRPEVIEAICWSKEGF